MSFETGGRADKLGNRYEGRWLVKQLLRLLREEIVSVEVEAIGDEEKGVDLIIENHDNSVEYHQCKSRNGNNDYWTIGELNSRDVLKNAKYQLDNQKNCIYHLVSPFNEIKLSDIIYRTHTSGNAEAFYKYQILGKAKKIENEFKSFLKYFSLNIDDENDIEKAYEYLKRIAIEVYPDSTTQKKDLLIEISRYYIGDSESIYSLLKDFALENNFLGKKITASILSNYLLKKKILCRDLHKDERVVPNINKLNERFRESFITINNNFIERDECNICFDKVVNGNSIILHGQAGYGKSGCVQGLVNLLNENNIYYLAIKLDTIIPEKTADNYGYDIGLPASPILCLDEVSKSQKAVLILDQLDAVRWTNAKSSSSLDVIKDIIKTTENINIERAEKISIVFVCRTFDLNNDNGIKNLFLNNYSQDKSKIKFEDIEIAKLDKEKVKVIIGDAWDKMPKELQEILRIPSSLYIWFRLTDDNKKKESYKTPIDLVREWWNQLKQNYENYGTIREIEDLKDEIIRLLNDTDEIHVEEILLSKLSIRAKEYLLSNGLLFKQDNYIKFMHQSYYEYFIVEDRIREVIKGESIIDIIGDRTKQTPKVRYHLQMVLEHFIRGDISRFIKIGRELLESKDVRFYIKHVFLEVLSQAETIDIQTERFLTDYMDHNFWNNHLIETVFLRHAVFVEFLIKKKYIQRWNNSENYNIVYELLYSVNNDISDLVVSVLEPIAYKNSENARKCYNCLCRWVENDSEKMFEFRLKLLNYDNDLLNNYFNWLNLISEKPERAIIILELIVKSGVFDSRRNSNFLDQKNIIKICDEAKNHAEYIWDNFMPYLADFTKDIEKWYDEKAELFIIKKHMHQLFGRAYVELIKAAASTLIQTDAKKFIETCGQYYNNISIVVNEILLFVMLDLPSEYSDYVINWLLEKLEYRIFDYSGTSDSYLLSAQKVIEKHSKTCSDEIFNNLDSKIYYYFSKSEKELYKYALNSYANKRMSGNTNNYEYSRSKWGNVQYHLLPKLDENRISSKSKELLSVLERKLYIANNSMYKRSHSTGGWVTSTINDVAERLSDSEWIRIISNKKLSKNDNAKWISDVDSIKESTHEQFARDFERVGKLNPIRFTELALQFPEEINKRYIYALFNIIGDRKDNEDVFKVDLDMATKLFIEYLDINDYNITSAFCWAIEHWPNENWSDEIFALISNIAVHCPNPENGKMNITSSEDEEYKKISSLVSNSINCGRGCAAVAMSRLIIADNDRYYVFKDVINSLVNDTHLAVNMAAIRCIRAIYNIDKENATKWLLELAKKDLRLVASSDAYHLLYPTYKTNKQEIKRLIMSMYNSDYEDVSETGAHHLVNFYLLYNCFKYKVFYIGNKSNNQIKGILSVTVALFDNETFHRKCLKILKRYETVEGFADSIFSLLIDNKIDATNDLRFIVRLSKNRNIMTKMRTFLKYIEENDVPVEKLSKAVFESCINVSNNGKEVINDISTSTYGAAEKLSNLLILLYHRTIDDFSTNQKCLDMWDLMYENRIGTVRELTNTIYDG